MYAFLCYQRPRSVNAAGTRTYQRLLREALELYVPQVQRLDGILYGTVYYLHRRHNQLDADNLSKPIWDALEGILYDDDSRIRLRHAGVIDLRQNDLDIFDLSNMPDNVATDLIDAVGTRDHILYIEIGVLTDTMFVFGMERA